MNLQTLPGLFISHGSPMLALNPEQVGPALERLSVNLPRPEAIIVMSAHWESNALEVNTGIRPETWHDFLASHLNYINYVILRRVNQNWLNRFSACCLKLALAPMPIIHARVIMACGCHCYICIRMQIFR